MAAGALRLLGIAALPLALMTVAPPLRAVPAPAAPQFAACLARLQPQALAAGVAAATYRMHTAALTPDREVLDLLDAQPEFVTPIWDYLAGLVDDERVAAGRAMLDRHRDVLARVAQRYGVDPATVVAVWGVESDYGQRFGARPVLRSLATLACSGRRQEYFRGELFAALRVVQAGDVDPAQLRGSWAGAFGHTQFMPSTFLRSAVDFDGDGRRDLIGSVPDALASTANYLKTSNWRRGEPWGLEVTLPADFDKTPTGRTARRALADWAARGVTRVDGAPLIGPGLATAQRAAILIPAGIGGPAFVVLRNFDALYRYNAAESYALAIALLADRLRAGAGVARAWPTDDPGLSRVQRRQLQALLLARGHAIGAADGMIGSKTRHAIQAEQRRLKLPDDGRAGQRILRELQAEVVP